MAHKFCTKCGAPLEPTYKFCKKCGNPVPQAAPVQSAPVVEETPVVEAKPAVEETAAEESTVLLEQNIQEEVLTHDEQESDRTVVLEADINENTVSEITEAPELGAVMLEAAPSQQPKAFDPDRTQGMMLDASQTQAYVQQMPAPKKKSGGIVALTIILVLLILITLGMGAFLAYKLFFEDDTYDSADHRYKLVLQNVTWDEAYELAQEEGGYLAVITSEKEEADLKEYLETQGDEVQVVYIGASCEDSEEYEWINGKEFEYTDWGKDEPSKVDGEQSYIAFFSEDGKDWAWKNCPGDMGDQEDGKYSKSMGFLIEYDE